jgi:hypothetical protein
VRIAAEFSHRNADDILRSPKFVGAYTEFRDVIQGLPPYKAAKIKKTSPSHVIAPGAMNHWLDNELCINRDWDWHPLIIEADPTDLSGKSKLRSDFRKSRIEVEVQFGNVARYAYDLYKMAISLAQEHADVGLMVVATKRFAGITGGNIAYFERAQRELERSRLTLIVPLVVLGIEPDDWDPSKYPPERDAPDVTAADINAARRRRGLQPVPDDANVETDLPLDVLRDLASRVA